MRAQCCRGSGPAGVRWHSPWGLRVRTTARQKWLGGILHPGEREQLIHRHHPKLGGSPSTALGPCMAFTRTIYTLPWHHLQAVALPTAIFRPEKQALRRWPFDSVLSQIHVKDLIPVPENGRATTLQVRQACDDARKPPRVLGTRVGAMPEHALAEPGASRRSPSHSRAAYGALLLLGVGPSGCSSPRTPMRRIL